MLKRLRGIILLIILLSMIGCKSEQAETGMASLSPDISPTSITPVESSPTIGTFTEDDLSIDIEGVKVSTRSKLKDLQPIVDWQKNEKLPNGRVKLDSYEGDIVFRWGYPSTNPLYTLTIQDKVSSGAVNIAQIALAKEATTRKGLRSNDSYDKMISLYGQPTKDEKDMGTASIAYYFIGDHAMIVSYDIDTRLIYGISFTNKRELDKMYINRSDRPDSDELPPVEERDFAATFLGISEAERMNTFLDNFALNLSSLYSVYWFDPMDTYIKRGSKLWKAYEEEEKAYASKKANVVIRQTVKTVDLKQRFVIIEESRHVTYPSLDPNAKVETSTKTIKYILAPDQLKFIDFQIL